MRQIPTQMQVPYDALLVEIAIPRESHGHYRKWLRYYLDFCLKYNFIQSNKEILPHFIKKLKDKKQTAEQPNQSSHEMSLCAENSIKQVR